MAQRSYFAECRRMLQEHAEVIRLLEAKLLTSSATVDDLSAAIRLLKAEHLALGVLLQQLK